MTRCSLVLFRPPINKIFTHIGKGIPGRLGFLRVLCFTYLGIPISGLLYPFSDTAGVTGQVWQCWGFLCLRRAEQGIGMIVRSTNNMQS